MLLKELLLENTQQLPEDVKKALVNLALQQRGAPEQQMLRLQKTLGGGVLNPVVEHAGDLIHRMSEMAKWKLDENSDMGQGYVEEKAKYVLSILIKPTFEEEMERNFKSNLEGTNLSIEEFRKKVFDELAKYGEEHSKLPAYNDLHILSRSACVLIGRRQFQEAISHLKHVLHIATNSSREQWIEEATKVERNEDGSLNTW